MLNGTKEIMNIKHLEHWNTSKHLKLRNNKPEMAFKTGIKSQLAYLQFWTIKKVSLAESSMELY